MDRPRRIPKVKTAPILIINIKPKKTQRSKKAKISHLGHTNDKAKTKPISKEAVGKCTKC